MLDAQAILVADALTSPVLRFLDIGGTFKRFILAPLVSHESLVLFLQKGTDYYLAERYTDIVKSMLMALYFSAIFPLGYFYATVSCFISFWVDKYCFLRVFREKKPSGAKLVRSSRALAGFMILIHSVVTAQYYYSWPFDNLCETETPLSVTGTLNAKLLRALPAVYRQCSSVSPSLIPPTRKEPWMQADGFQYDLVAFYNVVTILAFIYVGITYLASGAAGSLYSLFVYKHTVYGKLSNRKFSDVFGGLGYVPEFEVYAEDETVLVVYAPHQFKPSKESWEPNGCGGLEFNQYLLSWVASKQCHEYEPPNPKPANDESRPLTKEQVDSIYRLSNMWADNLFDLFPREWTPERKEKAKKKLFAQAKQYIWEIQDSNQALPTVKKFVTKNSIRMAHANSMKSMSMSEKSISSTEGISLDSQPDEFTGAGKDDVAINEDQPGTVF